TPHHLEAEGIRLVVAEDALDDLLHGAIHQIPLFTVEEIERRKLGLSNLPKEVARLFLICLCHRLSSGVVQLRSACRQPRSELVARYTNRPVERIRRSEEHTPELQ